MLISLHLEDIAARSPVVASTDAHEPSTHLMYQRVVVVGQFVKLDRHVEVSNSEHDPSAGASTHIAEGER